MSENLCLRAFTELLKVTFTTGAVTTCGFQVGRWIVGILPLNLLPPI
jgi:hypothetical protein